MTLEDLEASIAFEVLLIYSKKISPQMAINNLKKIAVDYANPPFSPILNDIIVESERK